MRNRINKLLKIGILCFAMALIQTSCEKNDNAIDNELQQEKKISRITFSDFNINVTHNRQYQDLEKHFDIKKSSNQNLQNRIDANDDITVLTDEILVIQKNDISYYTFKIVAPSENNEFYNLVVHVNNQQQITKSELYEYIPDSNWLQDINQPYTGLIKVLDNDIISLDDLFSARGSGRCLTGASGEWNCGANKNHEPGHTNCDPANNAVTEYIITLEYGRCPNEPVDYIIAEAPSPIRAGGGSSNESPTPTIPTTPCEQNDGIATQTIGITDGNGGCLNSDCILINDFDIDCNILLSFEQDYKNRMSVSEKQIFESMSRFNQLGYLANAQKATWKSEELFPNSIYNGKGDAFRHAYWNALNVILLGDNLAESLTTAHEDKPAPIGYTNHYKEVQMDLFNNEIGRNRSSWFWDGYASLEESILDALNTGQLRYLNNLAFNGRATSNSQLIPTNQ